MKRKRVRCRLVIPSIKPIIASVQISWSRIDVAILANARIDEIIAVGGPRNMIIRREKRTKVGSGPYSAVNARTSARARSPVRLEMILSLASSVVPDLLMCSD